MAHRQRPGLIHHQWWRRAQPARHHHKVVSVKSVEHAGQNLFLMLVTANTNGIQTPEILRGAPRDKKKAPSCKRQASSWFKLQAASLKPQAASFKRQATGDKLFDSWATKHLITIHGSWTEGLDQDKSILRMLYVKWNLVWWKSNFSTLRYFQFNCEKCARIIIPQ